MSILDQHRADVPPPVRHEPEPYDHKFTFEFCGNCHKEVLASSLVPAEQDGVDIWVCPECVYNCNGFVYSIPEPQTSNYTPNE